jgi:hypothetical protein
VHDLSFFHIPLFVWLIPIDNQKTNDMMNRNNNTLENSSARVSIRVGSLRSE